jgi:ribonuclease H-related protein
MPSQYEKELRAKANAFLTALAGAGKTAQIDDKSLRDYSLALRVGSLVATIYYSPKRKEYTLSPASLPKSILDVWENLEAVKIVKPKSISSAKTPYQAYVDGSYHAQKRTVGYGAIILKNGSEELARFLGRVDEYTESRQVGGELAATMRVIQWCQQEKIEAIDIYYDYKGIEAWARGTWKAEKEMTQAYAQFMRESGVKVHWHKVESHTGDYWNEIVDKLAKEGALKK